MPLVVAVARTDVVETLFDRTLVGETIDSVPTSIVMLVSDFEPENAWFPILTSTLPDPNVTVVSAVAFSNALFPMLVTPSGILIVPAQLEPADTTPLVTVKLGVELDGIPVVHRYVPFGACVATVSPFHVVPAFAKPMAVDMT
jgi:hypothetical protein